MAKKPKMNPKVKKMWVDALRSGKYKQAKGQLHRTDSNGESYCCLGVLCKLHAKTKKKKCFDSYDEYMGEGGVLPPPVVEWAGIVAAYKANPLIGAHSASIWNDKKDMNFEQIADLIEQHL